MIRLHIWDTMCNEINQITHERYISDTNIAIFFNLVFFFNVCNNLERFHKISTVYFR